MHKISELKSFSTLINLLEKDPTSCIDLTRECLDNISKQKDLNAFLRTYPEEALERAAQVATKLQAKKFGKLAGMVVGLKDLLCYQDHPVQGSSKILENFISQFSATAVQRLID